MDILCSSSHASCSSRWNFVFASVLQPISICSHVFFACIQSRNLCCLCHIYPGWNTATRDKLCLICYSSCRCQQIGRTMAYDYTCCDVRFHIESIISLEAEKQANIPNSIDTEFVRLEQWNVESPPPSSRDCNGLFVSEFMACICTSIKEKLNYDYNGWFSWVVHVNQPNVL